MTNEWHNKKIIKSWEDFAPELSEYLDYISEFMKEHDKRVEDLEKHCGLDLPF
tara:strand:- start:224 stop:382 length:159 start_codon:yes stop_codon:yes gene_type:complete